ncbi:MAG: InlB B-repeat-containing protein [Prevotellaceae bacterium]|jgi:uncharacterized repeat protein (TIGR02543 family)|nr:InlB B-repeat-containing protein [Prevotellaceae bacterium]
MKKVFYSLFLFLLNTLITTSIYAQLDGDGSESNPIKINNATDLGHMRDYCGETYAGKHFRLTDNFTVLSTWQASIGTSDNRFKGHFHGGCYTITFNLNNLNNNYAGLFGYNEGTIDSLSIEGTVKGGQYAGGLVAYNTGAITFCHANVTVEGNSLSYAAHVGGLVGYNGGTIQSSSAEGNVTSSGSSAAYSGGLVGHNHNNGVIKNCYAKKGDINALAYGGNTTAYSGGLVGHLHSGSVINSYSTKKPSAYSGNSTYTGAIAGYNTEGDISNCYFNINAAPAVGNNNGTASGKTEAAMQTRGTYENWDFENVWSIITDYPTLRTQPLRLKTLTVNPGILIPSFHPDTLQYKVNVIETVENIEIAAKSTFLTADININPPLIKGYNSIPVTIEHQGGKLVYMVTVFRSFTLNLNAQSGTLNPNTNTVTILSGVNELPVATRAGYDFNEWNTKSAGGGETFDNNTVQKASNVDTLYAQWTAKQYTLKFDANGGKVSQTSKPVTYAQPVGELPKPTLDDHTFDGWNTKQDGTGDNYTESTVYNVTHDTTVYAKWKEKEYILTFDANGGKVSQPNKTVYFNKPVGTLPTPERTGYKFDGWNDAKDGNGATYTNDQLYNLHKDTTVYAKWTIKEYTLKFNSQGGSENPQSIKINYEASVGTLPSPGTRDHYTFKGWNTLPDGKGNTYFDNNSYTIDGDTTFYAIWEGEKYTLIFDINYSGGTTSSKTVYYGSAVGTLPDHTRTGYTFNGWNTQKDGNGSIYDASTVYMATGNTTLYAQWTEKTYKLTYDAQGGTVSPDSKSITYGMSIGVLPKPVRTNYTFERWNANSDGTGANYTDNDLYKIDHDTTIYAIWTGDMSKLKFDAQGGTVDPVEKMVEYGSKVGQLPTPKRSGYYFAGWFTESGGSGTKYTENTEYKEPENTTTILFAYWTANSYKIKFHGNGGVITSSQDSIYVIFGNIIGDLLNNISAKRDHYTLTGWNTQPNGGGDTYNKDSSYDVPGNINLYAQWEIVKYKVTFKANTGQDPPTKLVAYNSPVGDLPTTGCLGYTPVWKDGASTTYDATSTITGDVTLYADCTITPNTYTLYFDVQGGSVNPTSKTVTYNAIVGDLPVPTRTGYTFGGWFTETGGQGTEYKSNVTKYETPYNSTAYAKWTCTLSFNSQNGNITPNDKTVTYGRPVGTLESPGAKDNYIFVEWNTKSNGVGDTYDKNTLYTIASGNATLYAIWKGKACTVQFITNTPCSINSIKVVEYGAELGEVPTCAGYIPQWVNSSGVPYLSQTEITGDIVLTSKTPWEEKKYTIKFNTNYPDGSSSICHTISDIGYEKQISFSGTFPTSSDFEKIPERYELNGWNTSSDGSGTIVVQDDNYKFSDDITLFAQWKGEECTVTFDANGGILNPPTTTKVDYNSTITCFPSASRTGYTFLVWNTNPYGSGDSYSKTTKYKAPDSTTLYAIWIPIQYTLSFDKQDGNGVYTSQKVTYDTKVGTLPEPTRDGYNFLAWNTMSNGKGTLYTADSAYTAIGDVTLYAQWDTIYYTLTFDANGGTTPNPVQVYYGSHLTILPYPTRDGYTFVIWKDDNGKEYKTDGKYQETANKTLYAQWTANKYTIKFVSNGGGNIEKGESTMVDIDNTMSVTYGQSIGALPTGTYQNYTLTGWKDGNGTLYHEGKIYDTANYITLYAQWTGNPYEITFNTNGGNETFSPNTVNYGSAIGNLPTPTRNGYKFTGWKNENGTTSYDNNTIVYSKMILYAHWETEYYTVTYNTNGGTPILPASDLTYNSLLKLAGPLTRTGYDHTGWNTRQDGYGDSYNVSDDYIVTRDTTLYAQWTPKTYTVTFEAEGGVSNESERKVDYNQQIGILPVPTRDGHTFKGWYTKQNGDGTQYDANNVITENTTLYAHWEINKYTITCYDNYPNAFMQETMPFGSTFTLQTLTRTGYTHTGWNTQASGKGIGYENDALVTVAGDLTLYAQWTINTYTVTFEAEGGVSNESERKVDYNQQIGKLPVPTWLGYDFKGWSTKQDETGVQYDENKVITQDTTLYAHWEIINYVLSYNVNISGSDIIIPNKTVTYGATIGTLPSVSARTGYTLSDKWNTKKDGSGDSYTDNDLYLATTNITLYAQWIPNTYTVTFNAKGGVLGEGATITVGYNSQIGTLPVPAREGYTFNGWFTAETGGTQYAATNVVTQNITLYAHWTVTSYYLQFDSRGGSSANDQPVIYGQKAGTLPVPTRSGYDFGGWFTDINGGGTQYTETTEYKVVGNTTLYAKWTIRKYTLIFDAQGGDQVSAISANYNEVVTLSSTVRTGYTFKGWNTSTNGNGIAYTGATPYAISGDATLYAQWTANTFTLDFDEQGGNPISNQTVTYDAATGVLPVSTRTGYVFKGWHTGIDGGGVQYTSTTIYKVAGNTTLYAKWEAEKYDLEFNANYAGGVNPATQLAVYGKTVTTLPVITRPGYIFKEWNTAQDGSGAKYTVETVYTETGNMKLYAQWIAGLYILSFEANYLENISKPENPASKNVVYGAEIGELPTLTHAGYIFTGWNTAENGSGVTYTATNIYAEAGNTTLYAQWTGISYTVNFTGINVEINPQPVIHGTKVIKPSDPTRQGYVFNGWYKDNELWDFNTPVTGDILLIAKWLSSDSELNSLTVTQGKLSPEFVSSRVDYNVLVSYDITSISVTGLQRHSGASVTGNVTDQSLAVGDNVLRIEVTAEDGVSKTIYTLLVTRADHILVSESNLLNMSANGRTLNIEGNKIEYVAACGETSFALELNASPYANVAIDGSPYYKGQVIEMTGDVTTVNIHIVSETGATKDYVLKANIALDENLLYYRRTGWDILGINANVSKNGGYEILEYRWYNYDGSYAGNKSYIQPKSALDYAEIRTVQTEGWRRVCGATTAMSTGQIAAYPNPVISGESVTLELPEEYVGGTLSIYNISGAISKSGLPLPASVNSINTSGLSSGIYLLNITGKDGNRQTVKIIVE